MNTMYVRDQKRFWLTDTKAKPNTKVSNWLIGSVENAFTYLQNCQTWMDTYGILKILRQRTI